MTSSEKNTEANIINQRATDVHLLHFEDEPNTTRWIPGVIFNHFCSLNPINKKGEGVEEEYPGNAASMSVTDGNKVFSITYRSIDDKGAFIEILKKIAESDATVIVLLDLMQQVEEGGLKAIGKEVFDEIYNGKIVDIKNIIFVTGYFDRVPKEIVNTLGEAAIWPKPMDTTDFASYLVSLIFSEGIDNG